MNQSKEELDMQRDIRSATMVDPMLNANGYVKNNPIEIIVHHTGGTDTDPKADTSNHTFEIVDDWHRQLWNFKSQLGHYIGYHYFIDKTGKVTQGRADYEAGAHTIGENTRSLGICLAGNFDVTLPTAEQEHALEHLLKQLLVAYDHIKVTDIHPHRRYAHKTCFGNRLANEWAQGIALRDDFEDLKLEARSIITNLKKETDRLELILNRIWQ